LKTSQWTITIPTVPIPFSRKRSAQSKGKDPQIDTFVVNLCYYFCQNINPIFKTSKQANILVVNFMMLVTLRGSMEVLVEHVHSNPISDKPTSQCKQLAVYQKCEGERSLSCLRGQEAQVVEHSKIEMNKESINPSGIRIEKICRKAGKGVKNESFATAPVFNLIKQVVQERNTRVRGSLERLLLRNDRGRKHIQRKEIVKDHKVSQGLSDESEPQTVDKVAFEF
jgi:hypothetical protein